MMATVSDADIAAYVADVLARTDINDAAKGAQIAAAAAQYGVSNTRIAQATGYTIDQVRRHLEALQLAVFCL